MPSRAAAGGMHRKAEEEPIAELWATTTTPRGARPGDAQQAGDPRGMPWHRLTAACGPRHPGCMIEAKVAPSATYQSAERVLALLKSFDDTRTELGVAEIARTLGVHKSTASRLAAALERAGFLARAGKRYRLGVEVIRLGSVALRSFDLVATMQP